MFERNYKMYYKYEDLVSSFNNLDKIVITEKITGVVMLLGCDGKSFCIRLTEIKGKDKNYYEKCFYSIGTFNDFVKWQRWINN